MPKANITLPDGTLVTIEGDPEEIRRILKLYSEREGAKAGAEERGGTVTLPPVLKLS